MKYPQTNEYYKARLIDLSVIDPITGCWNWKRSVNCGNYGAMSYRGKYIRVHRLSLYLFKGFNLESKLFVLHKCDNKICINPDHLFEGTTQDNMDDMVKKGRSCKGENNNLTKYTEKLVLEIRKLFKEGISRHDLMVKFNIPYESISNIVSKKYWKHVT